MAEFIRITMSENTALAIMHALDEYYSEVPGPKESFYNAQRHDFWATLAQLWENQLSKRDLYDGFGSPAFREYAGVTKL